MIRSVRVFILGCGILLLIYQIQYNIYIYHFEKLISHYFGRVELICVVPLHIILLDFFYFLKNWPDHLTSVDSHSTFKSVCTWVRINMHNPVFQAFFVLSPLWGS